MGKGKKPAWVDEPFTSYPYSYIDVTTATGYSEDEARNKAAQSIIVKRSLATGTRMTVKVINGEFVVTGEDKLTVKPLILDEYREQIRQGEYRVSLLVQTPRNPGENYTIEPVHVSDKYPFSARVFVPGMAQLHKGSTGKGICFIVGEVLLVGGIVVCEGLRASYESKISTTHNAADRARYIDNASTMENARNIAIAGAAAAYLWNVIDGIVAKGKKHVVVGNTRLGFAPYFDKEMNTGLTLILTPKIDKK